MKSLATSFLFVALVSTALSAPSLTPQPALQLTGTHGKFDFIKVDAAKRRLLACHTGNGSLDVIDLDDAHLIASVPTGAAQGVAVDEAKGRYFVSVSKPPQLVVVDASTLKITGTVALPEAADLCAYSPKLDWVFVNDDEKARTWIVDLASMTVIHEWQFLHDSGMEDIAFDPTGDVLVQNLKDTSKLLTVDFSAHPELASKNPGEINLPQGVSTLPAEKPHGLARVGGDKVLVAGGGGQLVLMNDKTGQVIASTATAAHVDEIAYDAGLGRAYGASGQGFISVVDVTPEALHLRDTVASSPGAHSIAVDPKTHQVWIAFAKGDVSFVQAFDPSAP